MAVEPLDVSRETFIGFPQSVIRKNLNYFGIRVGDGVSTSRADLRFDDSLRVLFKFAVSLIPSPIKRKCFVCDDSRNIVFRTQTKMMFVPMAQNGVSPYDDSRLVLRKFAISMIESPHRFAVPSPLGKGRSVAVGFCLNLQYPSLGFSLIDIIRRRLYNICSFS